MHKHKKNREGIEIFGYYCFVPFIGGKEREADFSGWKD